MKSRTRPAFWKLFADLPAEAQEQARKGFKLFSENPDHPSLNFKKLHGQGDFWSARVGGQYRVVGERKGDTITWLWIGTHNQYDKLF